MVNTFLVSDDFVESARSLDWRRLGKQRVEAYQILSIINNLKFLGDLFSYPYDINNDLKSWIKTITQYYQQQSFFIVIRNDHPYQVDKHNYHTFIDKDDHIIKLGFSYHPCVRMWFHHPEALKLYINIHINEWIDRGYRNNMTIYDCVDDPPRPSWTYDPQFHQNHRAALLAKELDRHEEPWYQYRAEFIEAGKFPGYIWPV